MPASPVPTLYRIDECSDLMADACVIDDQTNLVFLSVWARDTAIQQFLARLTLAASDDGLSQIHLLTEQGPSIPVLIGDVGRLDKRSTRNFRRTLFGSMVNLWLFDKRCVRPDKANASALALLPHGSAHLTERLWALVQDTCPLPLLDHWRDTVLALLRSSQMLTGLPGCIGPLEGFRLTLDVPALTLALGDLIRRDALTVSRAPSESERPQLQAA